MTAKSVGVGPQGDYGRKKMRCANGTASISGVPSELYMRMYAYVQNVAKYLIMLSSPAPLAQLVEHSAVIAIAFIIMSAQSTERSTVRTRHRALFAPQSHH